jgi:general stress protein 26
MNSDSTLTRPDAETLKRFAELVKDIKFAMLTTVTSDGSMRSRPMATMDTEFDGDLWFFTDDDSGKIDEITGEHQVCVSYAEPSKQKYVSVSGLASIVRDKQRARELWSPALKAWFPRGVDDPHLAMIRVRTHTAEYWDSPSSKMVQLFGFAKAVVTGKRLDKAGEHQKVDVIPRSEEI